MKSSAIVWILFYTSLTRRETLGSSRVDRFELWPDKGDIKFQSAGYPDFAPPNTIQQWTFVSPPGSYVVLSCNNIQIGSCINGNELTSPFYSTPHCNVNYLPGISAEVSVISITLKNGPIAGNKLNCIAGCYMKASRKIPDYLGQKTIEVNSSEYGVDDGTETTKCKCGRVNKNALKARIIGGGTTETDEYTFMAAVATLNYETAEYKRFCGGTIISERHVLTAAHCTYRYKDDIKNLVVVTGDINDKEGGMDNEKLTPVSRIFIHESYQDDTKDNTIFVGTYDICLLELKKKIEFNKLLGPVCLPTAGQGTVNVGENVKALGWGMTSYPGNTSRVLQKAWFNVIPFKNCQTTCDDANNKKCSGFGNQLCIFAKNKALCQGDSGGPILWLNPDTNMYTLVGITSFGMECSTYYPSVVTDVAKYMPWIEEKLQGSDCMLLDECIFC